MPRLRHRSMVTPLCVRCGQLPRAEGETWLCATCTADGKAYAEAIDAGKHGANVKERRRYVIERHGWSGGWPALRE